MSLHFSTKELSCKCCGTGGDTMNPALITLLEAIRVKLDAPITVLSGHRCHAHNKECGGAKASQHLLGNAVDIRTAKMTPHAFHDWIEEHFNPKGLGSYKTFTHIDVRPGDRARWAG